MLGAKVLHDEWHSLGRSFSVCDYRRFVDFSQNVLFKYQKVPLKSQASGDHSSAHCQEKQHVVQKSETTTCSSYEGTE